MTLVDTSVWIDWLRKGNRPTTLLLDKLVEEDSLFLVPVVLQELLQGARGQSQLDTLRLYFSALPMLIPSKDTYADAGRLYARCRWRGVTPRSPHVCLIAQIAIEHKLPLLQDDNDFALIARVEPGLQLYLN